MRFMVARVNTNSSSVWKSMAVAQPVLQKGLRWQVGDGRKIKIWHDQWLPRDSYFKVLSSPPSSWDKEATVNSLMLDALRQWNKWMLDSLFSQEEVSLIMGPPLSLRPVEDHVIWHHERNGRFSVHNVYHIAKSIQVASGEGANGSSLSSNSEMEKFWKMLWHACVPGKVVTPLLPTSFELCLMTIWTLWKARNDALWSGITLPLQELLIRAKRWLSEYHKYHKPPKRAAGHGIKRWKKPTEGMVPKGKHVVFERDSTIVMATMNGIGTEEDYLVMGPLINDLRSFIQLLQTSQITYLSRW
ncbi:uncharacterized protein [Malus domestica]|uniref:uncharacterized protein n=1 Tax=Malus domestica TaxID=3750 RepID=UPI00397581B5